MMKQLLIGLLSFTLAVPAWAVKPPTATQTVSDFLKESKISTESVSFKQLYQKYRRNQSMDVQREFDLYLKQNPDVKMPKATVTKLQQGKEEVVQIEFRRGADRMTMQIFGKRKTAHVTLLHAGKKTESNVGLYEMRNPIKWAAKLVGTKQVPWTQQVPSVQMLTGEQLKVMNAHDRNAYIDKVRALLAAAEKAQNTLHATGRKTSSSIWQLLETTAIADSPSGDCVIAGYMGAYQNGTCHAPDSATYGADNCLKCNPDIYGSDAPCPGPGSSRIPQDATNQCNIKTKDDPYSVFTGIKSEKGVQDKLQTLQGLLTTLQGQCSTIKKNIGSTALGDQADACAQLQQRAQDLANANCDALKKYPQRFPDLQCQPPPPDPPNPDPQTPLPVPNPDPQTPPTDQSPEDQGNCALPSNPTELNCSSKEVRSLTCNSDGADHYYCECGPNEDGDHSNSQITQFDSCSPKQNSGDNGSGKPDKPKHETSFFQPWMIGVGVGGGLMLLTYFMQKQALENYYAIAPVQPLGVGAIPASGTVLPGTR